MGVSLREVNATFQPETKIVQITLDDGSVHKLEFTSPVGLLARENVFHIGIKVGENFDRLYIPFKNLYPSADTTAAQFFANLEIEAATWLTRHVLKPLPQSRPQEDQQA